jgi:hypothetical protein
MLPSLRLAWLLVLLLWPALASAQGYPTKPIKFVVLRFPPAAPPIPPRACSARGWAPCLARVVIEIE